MTKPCQRLAAFLLAGAAFVLLPVGQARAGACDDPTDTSPRPRQIPNCQVQTQPQIKFTTLQHQYWLFKCTGANSQFLGNDQGYFSPGYELNNNCFSEMVWTPQFEDQLSVTFINWCDKPEPLVVSLGCMPPS